MTTYLASNNRITWLLLEIKTEYRKSSQKCRIDALIYVTHSILPSINCFFGYVVHSKLQYSRVPFLTQVNDIN